MSTLSRPSFSLADLRSGFMVFLIALPLCLGIAGASGCPPIAGIYTAIFGGILASLISNSALTIKGPAAGLIVIVLGCVTDSAALASAQGMSEAEIAIAAYRMTLAVAVVAGACQIGFGAMRGGILGDFFPSSAVHGLLASIGVIIMVKQIPVAFGVPKEALLDAQHHAMEPLDLIFHLPSILLHFNPLVAIVGLVGIIIMFGLPTLFPKVAKKLPPQVVVLLVTVPLAMFVLGMPRPGQPDRAYMAMGQEFVLSAKTHLVNVPDNALSQLSERGRGLLAGSFYPDFAVLRHAFAWKWVALFAIIGSLESLLSAKAVDLLDPLKRKTDLNRDLLAVGVANTAVAFFGGIPMIAEIVRSRANIDNGAQTRYSNMVHGFCLLAAVAAIPGLLNLIPLSALAAMLIFTGFRLAHPREFVHVLHYGREQLVVFVATIVGVLATDLLIGIFIGIGVKLLIHYVNGMPLNSVFKPILQIEQVDDDTYCIRASKSAVFSNWLQFRRQIVTYGILQEKNVIVDLSDTVLVDHSTMQKLLDLREDFAREHLTLTITGLDQHSNPSLHPVGTRIRIPAGETTGV